MKYSRIDITRDPFWFSLSQIIFLLKTGRLFLSLKISPLKTLPSKNLSLKNYPEEIYPQKSYPQKFTLEEINLEKNLPSKKSTHIRFVSRIPPIRITFRKSYVFARYFYLSFSHLNFIRMFQF